MTQYDAFGEPLPPARRANGHHPNGHPNGSTNDLRSHSLPLSSISDERGLGGQEGTAPERWGEVVAASTTEFLAQAIELDSAPPFGALVEVSLDDGLTIYGVVAHVETAGIDPGSRAIMRGHGDVRDERIYQENPDLPLVLRTTFRVLVVGFAERRQICQFLPPRPPRLHYSVFVCQVGALRSFTEAGLDYLVALLNAAEVPIDELVAANLRYVAARQPDPSGFLQQAGRELAQLLRTDYARLTSILRRCLAPSEVR
jgi:hypothetical protein